MYDARRIATLYARRRRLTLGLADFERRAEAYRKTLAETEAELRTMVLFVPPLIQRNRPIAVARGILDFLRAAETALSTREIALRVAAQRGLPADDPRLLWALQKCVAGSLRRMAGRGLVTCAVESGRVMRWDLTIS